MILGYFRNKIWSHTTKDKKFEVKKLENFKKDRFNSVVSKKINVVNDKNNDEFLKELITICIELEKAALPHAFIETKC